MTTVPPGQAAGLVSLGFLWAALRRTARRWCTLAVLGLIIGGRVLRSQPAGALRDDIRSCWRTTPARTRSTRCRPISPWPRAFRWPRPWSGNSGCRKPRKASSAPTAPPPRARRSLRSPRAGATSDKAVQIAQAIAQQFLAFRAAYQQTQYNLLQTQLDQELAAAQQQVSDGQHGGGEDGCANNLGAVQAYVTPTLAAAETTLQAMIKGSVVLNAAEPVKVSRPKGIVEYAAAGLRHRPRPGRWHRRDRRDHVRQAAAQR